MEYAEEQCNPPTPLFFRLWSLRKECRERRDRNSKLRIAYHQCEKLKSYELVTAKIQTECSH
jgi:hypothetical protein